MLRLLSSLSSSLHMLDFACLRNLFAYKMPMHRKYVRLKCVCHMFYDALFVLRFFSCMWVSLISQAYLNVYKKELVGRQPNSFCFFWCAHNYATIMAAFKLVFVPSMDFGMIWMIVALML